MNEVQPFKTSVEDYNFWLNNPTFELFCDLTTPIYTQDTSIEESANYHTLTNKAFAIRAKKYVALNTCIDQTANKITFEYKYNREIAFHTEITENTLVLFPDQTSCFPMWCAYKNGHLAIAQTYGDLLRLCKKNKLKITPKYKTDIELELLLQHNEVTYKEVFKLLPDFWLECTAKSITRFKLPLSTTDLVETTSMKDALNLLHDGFSEIEHFFPPATKQVGTAFSGGRDSAIITGLSRAYFNHKPLRTYTQLTNPKDQLLSIQLLCQNDSEIINKYIDMTPSGLAIVDPWDPYLNPYNKANFDLAQLIALETNVYFNGYGGNELFGTTPHDIDNGTPETHVDSVEKPYMHTSIIEAHQATSPFYLRHGVVPFSPYCMRNYYFKLLLVAEELKQNNNLYSAALKSLGLFEACGNKAHTHSLSMFFLGEYKKVAREFDNVGSLADYKHRKHEILISHRKLLHNLSLYHYNAEDEES